MATCPALFFNFIQRHYQPFPTSLDSTEQRSSSPLKAPACICTDFLGGSTTGNMWRSEGNFSNWSYLVSDRISLFFFCGIQLDDWMASSLGLPHLHLRLPIAVLGFQLFTLYIWLLHCLLWFELSMLTWQAIWSMAPSLQPSLPSSQLTQFTNLCLYHPVSECCPQLARIPRSFAWFWDPQLSHQC